MVPPWELKHGDIQVFVLFCFVLIWKGKLVVLAGNVSLHSRYYFCYVDASVNMTAALLLPPYSSTVKQGL